MTEYVQPIAVAKGGSHEEVVAAVAMASVTAFLTDVDGSIEPWQNWLNGPFTKTVRRGTNTQFIACFDQSLASIHINEAHAVAEAPRPADELGLPWSKMQVSGLERERTGMPWRGRKNAAEGFYGPVLHINPHVEMSTGKTAAQAAHALFAWVLNVGQVTVLDWVNRGSWMSLTDDPVFWEEAIISDPPVQIWDAVNTEIEPGTLTVVVPWP